MTIPSAARAPRSVPPPEGHVRIIVNLPIRLRHALRVRAAEQGETMSDLVIRAIEKELRGTPAT